MFKTMGRRGYIFWRLVIVFVACAFSLFLIAISRIEKIPLFSSATYECVLPDINPWDRRIMEYDNREFYKKIFDPYACTSNRSHVSLEFGVLKIDPIFANNCKYRCVELVDDHECNFRPWLNYSFAVPPQPECDFVEVSCQDGKYVDFVQQVFVPPEERRKGKQEGRPNVYLFGLDATSYAQFYRTMPRFSHFLAHQMEGFSFKHVSKIGSNSHPNDYATFFGKHVYSFDQVPAGFQPVVPDYQNNSHCYQNLKATDQFFPFVFADHGFRTAHIEDNRDHRRNINWVHRYFTDSQCSGFGFKHMDHLNTPLFCIPDSLFEQISRKSCKHAFTHTVDYFFKYAAAESAKPKFIMALTMMMTHDYINLGYGADQYLYEEFRKKQELLDDAVTVFWSDHGSLLSPLTWSEFGFDDARNPMLVIVLPKKLRDQPNHPVVQNLRENSKKLISHFDTYATMIDLATSNLYEDDFTHPLTLRQARWRTNGRVTELKGLSLLRPIDRPVNCQSINAPFQFCLCQFPLQQPELTVIGASYIRRVVRHLNQESSMRKDAKCGTLTFDDSKSYQVRRYERQMQPNRDLYLAEFSVHESDAKVEVIFEFQPTDGAVRLAAPIVLDHVVTMKQFNWLKFPYCPKVV